MNGVGLLVADDARARDVTVDVDGVDVTTRCLACDDRQGWALCYALDANGKTYARGATLATELLTGSVTLVTVAA